MDDKHNEIFRQYELKIYNMYRARGAFILETNQGLKLYKGFEGSKNHLEYENKVKTTLLKKGYKNVDILLRNKLDEYVTQDSSGNKYIIKNWFLGEECNLHDLESVKIAAENLAKLHNLLCDFHWNEEEKQGMYQSRLDETFVKHNRELKRVKSYIINKKQRNEFELNFLQAFDLFYEEAIQATELLAGIQYDELVNYVHEKECVCHGNYTYHNILVNNSEVATTNFEKSCIGVQINDLYQFVRKAMEKNNWNIEIGASIVNAYQKVRYLTDKEFRVLYILIQYPEKFWKVTNFYFNNKKSWISKRNIQKLTSLQLQQENKLNFLEYVKSLL